ncbi:MAG: Ig-like domain-containing protein, partial [Pikeienuella sp.]
MATYELSAFTEQELLDAGSGNGSNLGVGDSFTMPADNDAVISVWDNDGRLSGDSRWNENSTDKYGQIASITVDGVEVGNGGQIYAEKFFWVCDDAGNWYILLEIEQENASGDYFVFYDYYGLPEEGAELSLVSSRNITRCWEPRYDDMMQEPPFAPPIALNDMIEITEDESIGDASADAQLNVLANDFDVDSDFALTSVTNGAVGEAFTVTTAGGVEISVTIAADGSLTFDAAGQFDALNVGECDSFVIEYTIGDADGGESSANVTVVIHGAHDGPIAVADHFATTESGTITGNILENDDANGNDVAVASISADGQTFNPGDTFEITTEGGRTGTVTVQADGSFTFETNGQFDDLGEGETDEAVLSYLVTGDIIGENLIINGDFENHGELTRGYGDNRWDVFDSIEGWTTPTGQLEIQQGVHGGTAANSATNSILELDSHDSTDTNAGISQTVNIAEDGMFVLSLDYSPRQLGDLIGETSGVAVIVNGEVIANIASDTVGYENYSFTLDLAAGDNVIGFAGTGVDDTYGALLDNIELRGVATSEAEVSIVITGENEGPVAADDGFVVTEASN